MKFSLFYIVSLLIAALAVFGSAETSVNSTEVQYSTINPKNVGKQIVDDMYKLFWNGHSLTNDPRCDAGGLIVVWPVSVFFQALVDAEKAFKGQYTQHLDSIYNFMMNYYNAGKKGFSASQNKDNDIYYDDNAQVASALITAYEATGDKKYLDRGADVVSFLMGGWDTKYGGVYWHLGQNYVASISTLETALACLRLYKHTNREDLLEFAEKSLKFIIDVLMDKGQNLVYDGRSDGGSVNTAEFSYQVGTALSACTLLYKHTNNQYWKEYADKFAQGGTNRGDWIYNRDYPNQYRYWRDGLDFTQLLFEGVTDYTLEGLTDKKSDIALEARAQASFVYGFDKGSDNLYFTSVSPLTSSKDIYQRWTKFANTGKGFSLDKGEYCHGDPNKPNRSFMVQASAARIFLLTARVYDNIDLY